MAGQPLTTEQRVAARSAVGEAERGDFAASERYLGTLPHRHPVRELASLEVRYLRGEKVASDALQFAASEPGYGPAWGFAADAARREGDVRRALAAARRADALQPGGGWARVVGELERSWTAHLLEEGNALLSRGDAGQALARAREALEADAEAASARLLAVRALLALHDNRGAAELVPGLPDTAEGLELKGAVADALGQFDLAVELYSRLPDSDPRRCELVVSARRHWRLANAPPYLTEALAADPLNRKGLAAIVAFEAPGLAHRARGSVPVFEDVVELAERGDIVAAARAGVISGDPVTHRFDPERRVSPRELVGTLERLAAVLGRPKPDWCNGGARDCLNLPGVVDGRTAAALVLKIAGAGGEPCAQP